MSSTGLGRDGSESAPEYVRFVDWETRSVTDETALFEEFWEWIDLADSFKNYYTTGTGWGLKKVAPCAGFEWRASDADGEISMDYYEEQLAESNTQAARLWLLEYNEDDCLATLNVRHWLSSLAVG